MGACSSNFSEWNTDEKWSSQEWKSDEMSNTSTLRPVCGRPAGPFTQHTDKFVIDDDDMDSNTFTESDLSLKSGSFLHRVNDRVRKRLDQSSKDATKDSDKHSMIWRMLMSSTEQTSVFMGGNYSENLRSIKNTGNKLTMKQMFDISQKLIVGQLDEMYGVSPITWKDSSWKQLSLVRDEEVVSLSRAKVYVFFRLRIFRFCVIPWKDESEPRIKFCLGRKVELVQEFITIQNFGHN